MVSNELRELKVQLEALKNRLSQTQEAHKDATDDLQESEKSVSVAVRNLSHIKNEELALQRKLVKLQNDTTQLNQTTSVQQKLLAQHIYHQYVYGKPNYLQVILQEHDLKQTVRNMYYLPYIARARTERLATIQQSLASLSQLKTSTSSTLSRIEQLKQQRQIELETLRRERKAKQLIMQKLAQKIAKQRHELGKLQRDENRLSLLVKGLLSLKTTSRKATSTMRPPNEKSGNTVSAPPSLSTPFVADMPFASLKGKLHLPLDGRILNRFGEKREQGALYWKGMFISANEGDSVKAIAYGKVVFADWLRGFGNLMIVDHGGGYMSLYGNNQTLLKQLGDTVTQGMVIAQVGNSGGNENSGLYYELRQQSKPIDPMQWVR